MSDTTETSEQQPETGAEETVEETATEETGNSGEQPDNAQEADAGEEKPLTEADRKKFEAELRKKNSEAQNLRKRLKELEPAAAELQRLKDAELSESERLNKQLAAKEEQIASTRQRLVRTQVEALATAGFADPEDAVGALDLGSYIDESGEIDKDAIKADLEALLERKPHWAKPQPQEGPRRPAPDRTQASGAKQTRTLTPQDEFAGWLKTQLN